MSRNYQNHPERYPSVSATDLYIDWLIENSAKRELDFFDELNEFEEQEDDSTKNPTEQ